MQSASIETARASLGEVVDRARFSGEPTTVTRNGKPAAVVVSHEWFERATAALASGEPAQS